MADYVKFSVDKIVLKQLNNLQTFFGDSTREKLLRRIIPYAINKIAQQKPPSNLTREQEVAFQKLQDYHEDVCKSVGLLWPSISARPNEDEEEE